MSFMKNFFGGKGKKREEKEEGKTVRFRSVDSPSDHGRDQSIAFADGTFGEENLSEYARSKGARRRRTAQSLPGVNSDDTRSIGRQRDNRSVITPHHERHPIDVSPERLSFHLSRGQRNHRKRDYRSEIDLSLSDQENHNETRRRDEQNYVEKLLKKYKDQRNATKEENRRLREENDRLKKDRETMKNQISMITRELERYRGGFDSNNQWMVPPFNGPLHPPGSFPSHHSSFYQMGTDSYSSRATSAASSSTMNHNTNAGESLSMNSPIFHSSSLHTPQYPYS